jgi:hypothetical protein
VFAIRALVDCNSLSPCHVADGVFKLAVGIGASLEVDHTTGQKRARAQGIAVQLSGALHRCWLLVPSRIEFMLVQVIHHPHRPQDALRRPSPPTFVGGKKLLLPAAP